MWLKLFKKILKRRDCTARGPGARHPRPAGAERTSGQAEASGRRPPDPVPASALRYLYPPPFSRAPADAAFSSPWPCLTNPILAVLACDGHAVTVAGASREHHAAHARRQSRQWVSFRIECARARSAQTRAKAAGRLGEGDNVDATPRRPCRRPDGQRQMRHAANACATPIGSSARDPVGAHTRVRRCVRVFVCACARLSVRSALTFNSSRVSGRLSSSSSSSSFACVDGTASAIAAAISAAAPPWQSSRQRHTATEQTQKQMQTRAAETETETDAHHNPHTHTRQHEARRGRVHRIASHRVAWRCVLPSPRARRPPP